MKECIKCKEVKPLSEFYFRKDTNKYRNDCKKCRNSLDADQKRRKREYNKTYWQKNKEKEQKRYREWYDKTYFTEKQLQKRRRYNYKKYGLSETEFIELWESNNGKCHICNQEEFVKRDGKVKRLAIDHCHKTGKVRGLLCQNCNRGIGLLKDNVKVLKKAIEYLNEI